MADKKKAEFAPPASQVDLEQRLENGNRSNAILSTADSYEPPKESGKGYDYRVEGNEVEEYVGVSTEYATYANDTEKPYATGEENPEAEVFETFAEGLDPQVPEGWEPADSKEETSAQPADSADDETPDGDPVPQSGTTGSNPTGSSGS